MNVTTKCDFNLDISHISARTQDECESSICFYIQ